MIKKGIGFTCIVSGFLFAVFNIMAQLFLPNYRYVPGVTLLMIAIGMMLIFTGKEEKK